ncbi:Aste57867_10681 [Aphanomyces stellatus]|uniref:Aste57867_10681 protein n=1 Tax=Aphanomyces stellatus TaxID=120398 RepID=A0A485KR18_9STRA|nr:hypothetical protein As57867_010641 [Aphanomyces stellatus]VFT87553.1 Aste57867_10681 [Aphanomyces stellatus]
MVSTTESKFPRAATMTTSTMMLKKQSSSMRHVIERGEDQDAEYTRPVTPRGSARCLVSFEEAKTATQRLQRELLDPTKWTITGPFQRETRASAPHVIERPEGAEHVNLGGTFAPPEITSCYTSSAHEWFELAQTIPLDMRDDGSHVQLKLCYAARVNEAGLFRVTLQSRPSGTILFKEGGNVEAGVVWRQLRMAVETARVPRTDTALYFQWRGKAQDYPHVEGGDTSPAFVGVKVANLSLQLVDLTPDVCSPGGIQHDVVELPTIDPHKELIDPDKWTFIGSLIVETRADMPTLVDVPNEGAVLVNLGGTMAPRSIPFCYASSGSWGELLQTIPLLHRTMSRLQLTLSHAGRFDQGGQFTVDIVSLPSGHVLLDEHFVQPRGLTWRTLRRSLDATGMPRTDNLLVFKWSGTDTDGRDDGHFGVKLANVSLQFIPYEEDGHNDDSILPWF